jgi:23S rRNA-/tRNA-specific pseudouridylate synthase
VTKRKSDQTDNEAQIFRVLPKQVGHTIAAALRDWLSGQSWTQLRKLLESRRVMVSGNLCTDVGRRLKLQDVVKVLPHPMAAPPRETDVTVVYLDSQVIVVDKPSGVTSTRHSEEQNWSPRRRQIQPTKCCRRSSPAAKGGAAREDFLPCAPCIGWIAIPAA